MKNWYRLALFNLIVLTLLGLILRYKINFPLDFLEQKNLLHAHSHFAFNGWVSFLLQVLILDHFSNCFKDAPKFWNRFFLVSSIINYGMIISFAWVGYAAISIVLSTAALWLSYVFAYKLYKAIKKDKSESLSSLFVKAALFFLVFSSLGPYALAIIIAMKSSHQYWYHNALYFFLHFQYNGWFTFAVLAFFLHKTEGRVGFNYGAAKLFFWFLFISCFSAVLFTSLWHHRPLGVTVLIIISAFLQTITLVFLFRMSKNCGQGFKALPPILKWLYSLALIAFVLKVLLQLFSVHPDIAQLAFGFRPIIIGYLHLIFLVFVSLALLGILAEKGVISPTPFSRWALIIFSGAVVVNEIFLGVQGVASIYYYYLPHINILLFINTFLLLTGAILIYQSSAQINQQPNYLK